jgi:hypothetical protein
MLRRIPISHHFYEADLRADGPFQNFLQPATIQERVYHPDSSSDETRDRFNMVGLREDIEHFDALRAIAVLSKQCDVAGERDWVTVDQHERCWRCRDKCCNSGFSKAGTGRVSNNEVDRLIVGSCPFANFAANHGNITTGEIVFSVEARRLRLFEQRDLGDIGQHRGGKESHTAIRVDSVSCCCSFWGRSANCIDKQLGGADARLKERAGRHAKHDAIDDLGQEPSVTDVDILGNTADQACSGFAFRLGPACGDPSGIDRSTQRYFDARCNRQQRQQVGELLDGNLAAVHRHHGVGAFFAETKPTVGPTNNTNCRAISERFAGSSHVDDAVDNVGIDPANTAQRLPDDLSLRFKLGERVNVHPTAPATSHSSVITLRVDAVIRWLDDFGNRALSKVFLGRRQLDLDQFTRQCTSDKNNPSVVVARHGLAACNKSIWTHGETHSSSVGLRLCAASDTCLPEMKEWAMAGRKINTRVVETKDTDWYWDLDKKIAVRADNRGPGDQTLGPYDTQGEAENWQATSAKRNDAWDHDDEQWNDVNSSYD